MDPSHAIIPATYDREAIQPGIVHFGVGNFHRSHQARYIDHLLRRGDATDWGIVGVGVLPIDSTMRDVMRAQDCEYTLLERSPDGDETASRIASIVDYIFAPERPGDVFAALTDRRTRIASLTITEGGYNVSDATGEFDVSHPDVVADLGTPQAPRTAVGFIVEALQRRRLAGIAPFTVLSCDNIQTNGDVARRAVMGFARLLDRGLEQWIGENVAFPNCMVDRITPVTTDGDRTHLAARYGAHDAWPVVSESFTQWIIEDRFPSGRPPLERVGVQFVSDVIPYEKMKLRLLNGAHQALAHVGLLLGTEYAHDAVADPDIRRLLERYMNEEAAPTLLSTPGVDIDEYIRTLLERFGNAQIRDTLRRLATDAGDRVPKFVLPTIVENRQRSGTTRVGAIIVACWALRVATEAPGAVPDRQTDALRSAIERQHNSPHGFLDDEELFGSLASDTEFAEQFARAYAVLQSASSIRDGLQQAMTDE